MDKLEHYREILHKLLEDFAKLGDIDDTVETQIIADTVRDHYQLVQVGWQNDWRIYGGSASTFSERKMKIVG